MRYSNGIVFLLYQLSWYMDVRFFCTGITTIKNGSIWYHFRAPDIRIIFIKHWYLYGRYMVSMMCNCADYPFITWYWYHSHFKKNPYFYCPFLCSSKEKAEKKRRPADKSLSSFASRFSGSEELTCHRHAHTATLLIRKTFAHPGLFKGVTDI